MLSAVAFHRLSAVRAAALRHACLCLNGLNHQCRPVIIETMSFLSVEAVSRMLICWPRRRMQMRSERRNTWSRLWLMIRIAILRTSELLTRSNTVMFDILTGSVFDPLRQSAVTGEEGKCTLEEVAAPYRNGTLERLIAARPSMLTTRSEPPSASTSFSQKETRAVARAQCGAIECLLAARPRILNAASVPSSFPKVNLAVGRF